MIFFPTAQTLQRDNVEDDLDAEMPLVSPPTTPPNPTQLQHENGSSLGKFSIKARMIYRYWGNLQNDKRLEMENICILCHNYWTN